MRETDRSDADRRISSPAAQLSEAPITVLFIGGEGRSGSTILSAILGNHEGYFPVGELPDVWQALRTNELCGCGKPFASCPFWCAVGDEAFGGWETVDVQEVLYEQARYTRHRRIPQLLLGSRDHSYDGNFRAYCQRLGQLYRAIREVSGCQVIVDSTKSPPFAMLLRNVPGIELRVAHLVRDSRGVAFSWTKRDIKNVQYREHPTLKDRSMATMSPWKSALWWDFKNLLLNSFIPADQRILVRYERFTAAPDQELLRIFQFAEGRSSSERTRVLPHSTFTSQPFHALGGNRVRFARGSISVRTDTTWRAEMPLVQKVIVGGLTLPLLIAYGYADPPWSRRTGSVDLAWKRDRTGGA